MSAIAGPLEATAQSRAARGRSAAFAAGLSRWVSTAALVALPLAVAAIRGSIPYFTSQSGAGQIEGYAAHPAAYLPVALSGLVIVLTAPLAIPALGRLTRSRSPLLTLAGVPLATAGWIMVAVLVSIDTFAYQLAESGTEGAGAVLDAMSSRDLFTSAGFSIFIAGHLLGMLLLALALARSGLPAAGALIAVGDVLHPIALLALHIQRLDVVAYLIMAAGMLLVARAFWGSEPR